MTSNKKGQSAIEFIILIGAVLFFFIVLFFIIQLNISQKNEEKKDVIIKQIAYNIQKELLLASETSNGYIREFEIPQKLINEDYNVSILEGYIYLRTEDNLHAIALPAPNVTGDLKIGKNIIMKKGGVIYLND